MSNFAKRILFARILTRRILAAIEIDETVGKIMRVEFERVKPEGRAKEAYRTTIDPSNIKDMARRLKNRLGFTSSLKITTTDPKATLVPGTLRLYSVDKRLVGNQSRDFVKVYFVKSGLVYLTYTTEG